MMKIHLLLNLLAVMLMSTSNPEANDAGGLIFGIMIILVAALIVISEAYRQMDAVTYRVNLKRRIGET